MYYILQDREPIKVDVTTWATSMKQDRNVGRTQVQDYLVSTVFLGLDHNHSGDGPPILFETMIFKEGSWKDEYCERYSTWKEAERGHQRAVLKAMEWNTTTTP